MLLLVVSADNFCENIECHPAEQYIEPFFCISNDNNCFLLPNDCVLIHLRCMSPDKDYKRDFNGICGAVPDIHSVY